MRVSKTSRVCRDRSRCREEGFTLVEMAVVLVIIGLILGAVMIGRDAQRNAEYVKIRQTFVNQWAAAYNAYYQRMGVPLGDDPTTPRLMVDGANYSPSGSTLSGGNMTGVTAPSAVCNGAAGPGMGRAADPNINLRNLLLLAGIELPQGRGTGREDRYVYLDTNGNPQELQVCFQWNPPGTPSGSGNVMVITGLTPDLARSLASAIKGNADANSGSFRQEGVANGAGGSTQDWAGNNTNSYNTTGTASGVVANTREAQVLTLVANYKMNQ